MVVSTAFHYHNFKTSPTAGKAKGGMREECLVGESVCGGVESIFRTVYS